MLDVVEAFTVNTSYAYFGSKHHSLGYPATLLFKFPTEWHSPRYYQTVASLLVSSLAVTKFARSSS